MAGIPLQALNSWGSNLGKCAEHLLEKIPETADWEVLRKFVGDVAQLLGKGDFTAGFRACRRIFPFVQKALTNVDKCVHANENYELTESITKHFLVDEAAREYIEKCLKTLKDKLEDTRQRIEGFAKDIDVILHDVIMEKKDMSFWVTVRMTFEMNRITAMVRTCEDMLRRVRIMIDELDMHVAGKSLMAIVLSYICFFIGIGLSASGNVPTGMACIATATATRKSAQKLDEYRANLSKIDKNHQDLEMELAEWKHQFNAEQKNFILLFGLKKGLFVLLLLMISLLVMGKSGNMLLFACFALLLVVRTETSRGSQWCMAVLVMGILAMAMEHSHYQGLLAFNTAGCLFMLLVFVGVVEP